jgi:hypothetical protein
MKNMLRSTLVVILFLSSVMTINVSGQAPPPPSHSQNGNQASPGGTGCPIDRTEGLLVALAIGLCYGGFTLYMRNKKANAQ